MSTDSAASTVRAPDGRKVTEVAVGVMVQPGDAVGRCPRSGRVAWQFARDWSGRKEQA